MHNPRARSAKLRIARRTDAPAGDSVEKDLGMPVLTGSGNRTLLSILIVCTVVGLAYWAYQENIKTQNALPRPKSCSGYWRGAR